MKKGDISMQTIVLVLIALIVMVIVISIFAQKMNAGSQDLDKCESKAGKCIPTGDCGGNNPGYPAGFVDCPQGDSHVCCVGANS